MGNYPLIKEQHKHNRSAKKRILIVDDDVASCRTLQLHFRNQGYEVAIAHSVDEGLATARICEPALVILDIRMSGKSGLEGLPEVKEAFPNVHVIMITAFHDMETTILAMQHGADDYIHKPIDIDEIEDVIDRILAPARNDIVMAEIETGASEYNTMVGRSRAMKEVFKTIGRVANSPATVLITGESGTGKELVSRAIHRASGKTGPFVAVNCAALVETLLESDMFGHERGAFTGAVSRQQGKFAYANDGTIFLDEVSELSSTMQAKLLRVIQEREFTPLGSQRSHKTNARVIAATNAELEDRVNEGLFREDLFYRLRVVTIEMPPLRERKEDILDLVHTLLARINLQMNREVTQVSMDLITSIQNYDWPGNVRELENVLIKAVALCPGDIITGEFSGEIGKNQASETQIDARPLSQWTLEEIEKAHVQRVLEATHWHRGKACEILGTSRPRLRRMIKHFNFIPPAHAIDDAADMDSDKGGLTEEPSEK